VRTTLAKWVGDADALEHIQRLGVSLKPPELSYLSTRGEDYYISLVGELFDRIREPYPDPIDWSRLGIAITQAGNIGQGTSGIVSQGVPPAESAVLAAAAFYLGGYPASAYITLKAIDASALSGNQLACYELLARPATVRSPSVGALVSAVRKGTLRVVRDLYEEALEQEGRNLNDGPEEWVASRLFRCMVERFAATNIRSILPDGESEFWHPLVRSLLERAPPVWDFFPSQIDAFKSGLLTSNSTFSIQMPTGAGKTALSETLLFYHLKKNPDNAAVLLVPYRSIASELRGTMVRRLNAMRLAARCAYGGTVPTGAEVRALGQTRAVIATPEALSGLLSADPSFFKRVSLVICDEGHLLDGQVRGIGLELLLSRMLARESGSPRFVFVSAIVPNIEEINAWLGGADDTVVRSDYRPAVAEFGVLHVSGSGASATVTLQLHPHEPETIRFSVKSFLTRDDFRYRNLKTGRLNTYSFGSVKTQAVACARKALAMGPVALFAANKRGSQGAMGLAEELLSQLERPLPLPSPAQFVPDNTALQSAVEYFGLEYGSKWVGTRALSAGVVLHHGDIPQESREVVESLVRHEKVGMAICTNTLAEGVNLPIRTLILYSVQRRGPDGAAENLLSRDIKNLVGRAGRAGATTKGLVICANPRQWSLVEPAAMQKPGERVSGALFQLIEALRSELRQRNLELTNEILEFDPALHALVDGIDTTLIDLAAEEVGEDGLVQIANELSGRTFAASQAGPESRELMRQVFELRARKVFAIRTAGRVDWIRDTGTRARIVDSIESSLLPLRERWDDIGSATDPVLLATMMVWAWDLPDIREAILRAYGDDAPSREEFVRLVRTWIEGKPLFEMAVSAGLGIDTLLRVHATVVSYALQVAFEQAVAILKRLLEEQRQDVSPAVLEFPEHVRFGVPTPVARILASGGVRHRRAAVALGQSPELAELETDDRIRIFVIAQQLLKDRDRWIAVLGRLVLEHTSVDIVEALEAQRSDDDQ